MGRARRFCAHPGCTIRVPKGRCREHARAYDRQRGTAAERLYTSRWQRISKRWLSKPGHQLCVYCQEKGRITAAECIDHEPPHRGDPVLFWDQSTWRPACISCNSRKAVLQEGGFGRRRGR